MRTSCVFHVKLVFELIRLQLPLFEGVSTMYSYWPCIPIPITCISSVEVVYLWALWHSVCELRCNVYVACRPCRAAGLLRFPVCKDPLRMPLRLVIRGQQDHHSLQCLFDQRALSQVKRILDEPSRIPSSQYELLHSGGRYGAQRCKLNRFKNSFSARISRCSKQKLKIREGH